MEAEPAVPIPIVASPDELTGAPKSANPPSPVRSLPNEKVHKPTNPQVDKPTNGVLPQLLNEKPQKYTTHLHPDMIKRIKIFAVEHERKDYEVVEKALTEYFERNK